MNESTLQAVEGLKSIVLELHRSAGSLDAIIQKIVETGEPGEFSGASSELFGYYLGAMRCRRDVDFKCRGFGYLHQRDVEIWDTLIASVKKKEP